MTTRLSSTLLLMATVAAVVAILTTAAPVRAQSSRWEVEANNVTYDATPTTVYKNNSGYITSDVLLFYSLFQVSPIVVETANFSFHVSYLSGSGDVDVYGVSGSYDPNTLNWSNQPAAGSLIATVNVSTAGWHTADITTYVNENQSTSFALIAVAEDSAVVIDYYPLITHPYIEYVPAPGTKPAAPLHCYNFDDNTDSIGTADFALQSGATLTGTAVVDTGIGVATAQTAATFPALATAANGGFTVAMWAQINDIEDIYQLEAADTEFRFLIEGDVRTQADSPFGNNVWNADTGALGWNYFAGGISSGGAGHIMVNTAYYTDTISSPVANINNLNLDLPNGGKVDQLMMFGYPLSRLEHLWVWNGGRGRSCWEFGTPSQVITYTISIPQPTPAYTSTLPFGNQGDVHLTMTAGDIVISLALIALATISLAVVLRDVAHRSAAK